MFAITGYSYEENQSAIINANISSSTKVNDRGIRSNDNVLIIDNIIFHSPNNFHNVASELENLRETNQLHLAQYESLRMRLGLGLEYLHNLFNIDVWKMAEELHNFLISQDRLIINCELDLTKEFIKKSFYVLLSGSIYHLCPKIEYRPDELKYKPYPHLLNYVNNPTPHPLETEKHWNGDPVLSIQY